MSGSDTASDNGRPLTPLVRPLGIMPRPGQPGALQFDGTNITEFLEDWNIECDDYGLSDPQKCARLPYYCTPSIKDVVKILSGYSSKEWTRLQSELKELYWHRDNPKNTVGALHKLIKEAPNMDLNVYVLKYTSITDALIAKGALSSLDRVSRLLDGLSEELRTSVFKFCTKKSWRLSTNDSGTTDPNFNELKAFVLTEAQTAQRLTVYDKERTMREGQTDISSKATILRSDPPVPAPVTPPVSAPVTASDPMVELTKQFSQLALLIQANMQDNLPPTSFNALPTLAQPLKA